MGVDHINSGSLYLLCGSGLGMFLSNFQWDSKFETWWSMVMLWEMVVSGLLLSCDLHWKGHSLLQGRDTFGP